LLDEKKVNLVKKLMIGLGDPLIEGSTSYPVGGCVTEEAPGPERAQPWSPRAGVRAPSFSPKIEGKLPPP
jgi:hypothetical protein